MTPDELIQHATAAFQAARYDEAASLIEQAIAISPPSAKLHANLSLALARQNRWGPAAMAARRAGELDPSNDAAWKWAGDLFRSAGQFAEAAEMYRRAAALRPDDAALHRSLGVALNKLGRLEEAVAEYRRALELDPNDAGVMVSLGGALDHLGQSEEAIAWLRRAVTLRPDLPEGHGTLGTALLGKDDLDEAGRCFGEALKLRGGFVDALVNMGMTLSRMGEPVEAAEYFDRAVAAAPDDRAVADNRLFAMLAHPGCDAYQLVREHRAWDERFARGAAKVVRREKTDRRMRIGYVSADFRAHVLGRNILPLLREHDRSEFAVYGYSNVARPDEMTGQMSALVDGWRNILGVTDIAAAEMIAADEIDILVDLSLHSEGNRLMALAHKPAAVQATFAGYPGTTGLVAIDYRLTDPYLDPVGMFDNCYTEKSIRLERTFWCYDARAWSLDQEAAITPLPAEGNGYVTFGSLNGFWKVNPPLLELWSRVLVAVPGSRLKVLAPLGEARKRLLSRMGKCGVEEGRIEFVARQSRGGYMAEYHAIDLGLDTLPYNGHTTSLDSMWMGVPVVSRVGGTVVGRAGWSQLCNLGLRELAGRDDEEFVKIAVELAGDLARLSELRRTLRRRMLDSPLTDAKGFARSIEGAYRRMWRESRRAE